MGEIVLNSPLSYDLLKKEKKKNLENEERRNQNGYH